ncbi:MAG: DinB family protein, partial [Phycisphaerales bacterium]
MDVATIRELFAYNDWGRDRLMAIAEGLSDAQLDCPFEVGEGSLRKTLEHLFGAEWTWLERCRGRSPVSGECPRDFPTTAGLWDNWRRVADGRNALIDALADVDLRRSVT